jgi:hypothetical protein
MEGGREMAGPSDIEVADSILLVPLPKPLRNEHCTYDALGITNPAPGHGGDGLDTATFSKV